LKSNIFHKLFFLLISAFILVLLFKKVEWQRVYNIYLLANPIWLFSGLFITLVGPFVITMRWHYALLAQQISLPFYRRFESIMVAYTSHLMTPSKTGDVVKGFVLRDLAPISMTTSAVVAERLGDIFVLLLLGLCGAIYESHFTQVVTIALILIASLGVILVFPINKSIKLSSFRLPNKVLTILIRGITVWKQNPVCMLTSCAWSLLQWLLAALQIYLFYSAMGVHIPISFVMATFPIATLVSLFPISFSGLGVREVVYIYFFSAFASAQVSIAVSLTYFVCNYIFTALIGMIFFFISQCDVRSIEKLHQL